MEQVSQMVFDEDKLDAMRKGKGGDYKESYDMGKFSSELFAIRPLTRLCEQGARRRNIAQTYGSETNTSLVCEHRVFLSKPHAASSSCEL